MLTKEFMPQFALVHRSSNIRVLIVDSGDDSCFLLVEFLRANSYEVFSLNSGDQWLQALADLAPDIILLDLKPYGVDCYKLLQQKQRHPQFHTIPTIVISACIEQIHRQAVLQLGACSFIVKPFLVEQLLSQIELHVWSKQDNHLLLTFPISA